MKGKGAEAESSSNSSAGGTSKRCITVTVFTVERYWTIVSEGLCPKGRLLSNRQIRDLSGRILLQSIALLILSRELSLKSAVMNILPSGRVHPKDQYLWNYSVTAHHPCH